MTSTQGTDFGQDDDKLRLDADLGKNVAFGYACIRAKKTPKVWMIFSLRTTCTYSISCIEMVLLS